jgi:hypothetical protein
MELKVYTVDEHGNHHLLNLVDLESVSAERDIALRRVAQLEKQLPEEMQDCTIRFISCDSGHGRLTAANWAAHGCPQCEINRLRLRIGIADRKEQAAQLALHEARTELESLRAPKVVDGRGMWKRRNGDIIAIKDMNDQHLCNAYRMLKREGFISATDFAALYSSSPGGDGAYAAWEAEVATAKISPRFAYLEAEINRRGLQA